MDTGVSCYLLLIVELAKLSWTELSLSQHVPVLCLHTFRRCCLCFDMTSASSFLFSLLQQHWIFQSCLVMAKTGIAPQGCMSVSWEADRISVSYFFFFCIPQRYLKTLHLICQSFGFTSYVVLASDTNFPSWEYVSFLPLNSPLRHQADNVFREQKKEDSRTHQGGKCGPAIP